ncbi:MAG: hypothetical protein HN763_05260 [Opitutales bacterium]|nr:hypothetical protein [Opitutales bacterium]
MNEPLGIEAKRFEGNPILSLEIIGDEAFDIHRETNSDPYASIAGPSLIRVPEWVAKPLGKYYLYFSHHKGEHIRMAYANNLEGPWNVYNPGKGVFHLNQTTGFALDHVASPDVHVDHRNEQIVMYYHSPYVDESLGQKTFAAISDDGLAFEANSPEVLGKMYMRVFRYRGYFYGVPRRGPMVRSLDGLTNFESGPDLFHYEDRHFALKLHNNRLFVFYSHELDKPETIKVVEMDVSDPNWMNWSLMKNPLEVLSPEKSYETNPVSILLDPYVYHEDGDHYLFYSVAKEQGIALAYLDVPLWSSLNITEVFAKSFRPYVVSEESLSIGDKSYLNSGYRMSNIPSSLRDVSWIQTDLADQRSSGSAQGFLSFSVDRDVIAFVAHDDRFERRPAWLMDWNDTDESIKVSGPGGKQSLSVFAKSFDSGHVALGGNVAIDEASPPDQRLMYLVAIKERK